MNEFFLKAESSSKSGTVYRIYAKEATEEGEKRQENSQETANQSIQDKSTRIPKKKGRKGKNKRIKGKKFIASANSWRVNLIEPFIKEIMKKNSAVKGFQQTLDGNRIQQSPSNNGDMIINEEDGVRLSVLFRSICRLQKMPRIDSILANVRTMNREEAYYWYSKIFPYRKNSKGMKAFRDLFG